MTVLLSRNVLSDKNDNTVDEGMLRSKVLFKRPPSNLADKLTIRHLRQTDLKTEENMDSFTSKERSLSRVTRHLKLLDSEHSGESELVNWKKHFHFASFPLFKFGNWIPFVMARWPCLGTGCGLAQVAFKNKKGRPVFRVKLKR